MKHEVELPETIKVGGYDYNIVIDPKRDIDLRSMNWSGSSSLMQQTIHLDSTLLPQNMSQTFIHELFHAIDRIYCNSKLTEDVNEQLANGFLQVFEQLGIRFVRSR